MIGKFRGNYFFLSNFYPAQVSYQGITYSTSEAAYQAQKTLSEAERKRFSKMDPETAKQEGQKIELREDWNFVKVNLMYEICKAKFTQNPELKSLLLSTGDEELVEGNNWGDTYWGVVDGVGENHLGKILMKIRSELK